MSTHDRDVMTACCVLLIGLGMLWLSLTLPMRGDFIESPGIFPGLMSLVLLVFGAAYAVRSLRRGGRIRLGQLDHSVRSLLASPERRSLLLGVLIPAVYVFIGVPLIGFYASSAVFMAGMFYAYVRAWRRRGLFLPVAIGITLGLYLIFNRLFLLQVW